MRIGVRPEGWLERIGLWFGLVPVALLEAQLSAILARAVTTGVGVDAFDALRGGPLTASEVAHRCGTDPAATALLLEALRASSHLTVLRGRYGLSGQSRKWLLEECPKSIRDLVLLQSLEWNWLGRLESFVRTGEPIDFHKAMSVDERALYHRGMRALAGIGGREVGRRTPVPARATRMLDLGGSHGHFAVEICRRHPGLQAEVLDLPDAIEGAGPLLLAEGMGDRVRHLSGDVTEFEFGTARYDLIFMSNLAHHLNEQQNRRLTARVARALRPRGLFVVQEFVRSETPGRNGQAGALLGLYFALQSRPNVRTWTVAEIADWQAAAGLQPLRPLRLRTALGSVQQAARR